MSGNNVIQMPGNHQARPDLNLPEPRIWKVEHLTSFLKVSVSWVYKRTMADAEDPIPRIAGTGRLRFDTASPKFQEWMRRYLGCGYVDNGGSND